MDAANGLLVAAAPGVTPTRSVRTSGRPPEVVRVGEGDELAPVAVRTARELAGAYASAAVIAPPAVRPDVEAAVAALPDDARPRITVLDPPDAKGLEFDAVVVVEPAAIAGETARGLRLLYVALTRAVQELVVVHRLPLPAGLDLT
jgi:UvrD-like helicase C-terminal domain